MPQLFRYKNKIAIQIFILGLLVLPLNVFALTQAEIDKQKADKQAELARLNDQLKQYQEQIAKQRALGASLSNEIALYNIEIQSTQIKIQATSTNIDNTNLQIEEVKKQIQQKTNEIEQEKVILSQLIVQLNEYDNTSAIQLGLSSNDFSDFLDQVQYTSSLQNKVYSLIQQIKELKAKLEKDQAELQAHLKELEELESQLEATRTTLNDQKAAKTQLLTQTRGQESRYRALATATQNQEAQIQREIYELDQQAQGQKGFKKLAPIHGILAWPMDGVVTQKYGNTGFTALGYNFHNGVDIAAPAGTSIYAAADGVVVGTGTGQAAYGNWVAIKHDITKAGHQIITLYGHMSSFKVKNGQSIKKGTLVGYEGNTGNTSRLLYGPDRGYHLHFTVFDAVGFKITPGSYTKVYGPYSVPSGYTYNPYDFL